MRALLLLPLLFITACSAAPDKYPFPPQYVSTAEVPPQTIPAPPTKGSAEYNREVDQIVAIQHKLTNKQIGEIQHQIDIKPEVLVYAVLGNQYDAAHYPKLYSLLKKVASDSWRIGDDARDYWKSPRPWYTEARVKRYVEEIRSPGYPSGHTTTFGSWAYVLADLFPQKREALFSKAWSVGGNRIAGGAHYPHDIAGGKKLAAAVYEALQHSQAYQQDFTAVQDEIMTAKIPAHVAAAKAGHAPHAVARPIPAF